MKKTHVVCGATVMTLTLGACGMGGGSDAAQGGGGGGADQSIVIDEPFGPAAGWALESDDAFVLSKLGCLEMLVTSTPTGELKPMLATSWEQAAPTIWEFTLREGATFQTGDPVDAQAVADALNHALNVTAPASVFAPGVVEEVSAADEHTVRVTTTAPDALLPQRLSTPNTGILAPQAYEGDTIDPKGTCTGPFTIVEEVPQQSVSLERYADYWDGPAELASAEVRFIPDGAMRATQIQTGEAHLARKLPVTGVQQLEGSSQVELETAELPRTTGLIMNNARAPFDDERVRQAIQAAIDTQQIAEAVYPGAASPAVGPFSPSEPFAPGDAATVTADPERAADLLAEAGVDPSSIDVELLTYTEGVGFADLAAVIQEQLAAIGVTVSIKNADWGSLEADALAGEFDMMLMSRNHFGDMPDPLGFLAADYTCEGSYNISQYCDQDLDVLVAEAGTAVEAEERYALYAEAAAELQESAVNVYLVHETETVALAGVTGYVLHPYYTLTADLARTSD